MHRFAWEYVAAVATFVIFIALLAFCVFLGRHEDSCELDGAEFTVVDSKFADRLLLCATRIHILEREVGMLKSRVDDIEIRTTYGSGYEDEKCRTEIQAIDSSR